MASPIRFERTLWPGEADIVVSKRPLDEVPALYFTDTAGRTWMRSSTGYLFEIDAVQYLS